jgi:protein CpxP
MTANFKPWLVLAVIFVAGILTGASLTIALSPHLTHAPGPHDMRKSWMARLTERLNLTADQQAKIQPIVTDAETKIQALHREEVGRGSQIFKSAHDQISALLTPAQQVELQKMENERKKMFSSHMHPGEPPHEGAGDSHAPGGPGDVDGTPGPPPNDASTNAPPAPR